MSNFIVGLDIGTSAIRVVIGEVDDDKNLKIKGVSKCPSKGLRNGVIVNIDAAMSVIKDAVEKAEMQAGVDVLSVYTAIGGSQVEGRSANGGVGVDVSRKNRRLEISEETKMRALSSAQAVELPFGKHLLHNIPQEYKIDEIPGYKDPVGILGVRLDVSAYLVSASITTLANIDECIKRTGLNLDGIMLKTLSASLATLHEEEKELGSILIDLGADSTDIIVLYKDAPIYITSIPVGGNYVTNDIVQVKGIPFADAEEIKIKYGCCWIEGNESEEEVVIREIGARPAELTTRYELCQIIQPRMDEIFSMARAAVVRHSGLKKLNGSIVLTGGGALMSGVVHLAQSVWRTTSVRVGEVSNFGDIDANGSSLNSYQRADFATVMGLVIYNKDKSVIEKKHKKVAKVQEETKEKGDMKKKVEEFLHKFF